MDRKILLTAPVDWWKQEWWRGPIEVNSPIYGLDFLAENIDTPHVLLGFPSREEYITCLKDDRFTDVGISFLLNHTDIVEEMISLTREIVDVRIVGGGHGAFNMRHVNEMFDDVCIGWGVEWLKRWLDEPINTPPYRLPVSDLKMGIGLAKIKVGSIIGNLGCTMGCEFCQITREYSKPIQVVSPDVAVEHMKRNRRRIYFFQDDNFFLHRKWIDEFFTERANQDERTPWITWGSTNLLSRYNIKELVGNGFLGVYIGYERSDYPKASMAEGITEELRDNDILILGSFILGWEDQMKDDIEREIEWALRLKCDAYFFACYVPLPNTSGGERLKDRVIEEDPSKWGSGEYLVWEHPNIEREWLEEKVREAYRRANPSIGRIARIIAKSQM